MWKCVGTLIVVVVVVQTTSAEELEENNLLKKDDRGTEKNETWKNNLTEQRSRQSWEGCLHTPSSRCVKLAMARALDYLPVSGVQVAPGISLMANSSKSVEAMEALKALLAADAPGLRLLTRLRQFLNSLTVRVQLHDPALLMKVKDLSEEVVDGLVADHEIEGRKKGGGGAAMWAAGALAAAGFAALAAMAGKALMASMAALMLAGMGALRGGGGGGGGGHKASHVEIIKAPAHYELAPMPVHHEGQYAFEHDHYYST